MVKKGKFKLFVKAFDVQQIFTDASEREDESSTLKDLIKVLGRFGQDSPSSSSSENSDHSDETNEFVRGPRQPLNKVFIFRNIAPIDFMRFFTNGKKL